MSRITINDVAYRKTIFKKLKKGFILGHATVANIAGRSVSSKYRFIDGQRLARIFFQARQFVEKKLPIPKACVFLNKQSWRAI